MFAVLFRTPNTSPNTWSVASQAVYTALEVATNVATGFSKTNPQNTYFVLSVVMMSETTTEMIKYER